MFVGLGTSLRILIDALDGAVDDAYRQANLDFRARYYPYFTLLMQQDGRSVGELAASLGLTQPAVTQTLALMKGAGLVELGPSTDRRERRYRLTGKARQMLPDLRRIWRAADEAAAELDRKLSAPLGETVLGSLKILSQKPFKQMIEEALRGEVSGHEPDSAVAGGPVSGAAKGGHRS